MNERGEALLETVLIAPVILLLGLIATEYGVSALRRSQLSESIRSTINLELVNAQDTDSIQDGQLMEIALKEKIKRLPALDENRPLAIEVKLHASRESRTKLPFLSLQQDLILLEKPRVCEVRVRAYSKTLFGLFLELPPLDDIVKHRLRG